MELRKGDVVKVEGLVQFQASGLVYFKVRDTVISAPRESVELARHGLVVGDRVVVFNEHGGDTGLRGKVLAISGDFVWLDCDDDGMRTALAARCQRIAEATEPAPPALGGNVPMPDMSVPEVEYVTADGDTLEAVAYVFSTSVDTIRTLNEHVQLFGNSQKLSAGIVLKVADNRITF